MGPEALSTVRKLEVHFQIFTRDTGTRASILRTYLHKELFVLRECTLQNPHIPFAIRIIERDELAVAVVDLTGSASVSVRELSGPFVEGPGYAQRTKHELGEWLEKLNNNRTCS